MRYEKYKKSISPFLEEIPFHWKETYLSHAYSLSSDTGHTEEQLLSVFLDKGVVSYSSTDQKQVHKPSEGWRELYVSCTEHRPDAESSQRPSRPKRIDL